MEGKLNKNAPKILGAKNMKLYIKNRVGINIFLLNLHFFFKTEQRAYRFVIVNSRNSGT